MRVALTATGAHASLDRSRGALGGPRVLRFCVQTQMPCDVMMSDDVMMLDDVMMSNARGPGRPPRWARWVYIGVYPCTITGIKLYITLKAIIIINM